MAKHRHTRARGGGMVDVTGDFALTAEEINSVIDRGAPG
jgi:hypothetical protein